MSEATTPAAGTPAGMPCPRCGVDLLMSERQGIEIDYCPKCRGVWLDRGELDKIIERAAAAEAAGAAPAPSEAPPQPPQSQPSPWLAPQPQYQPPPAPYHGAPDPYYGHGGGHHGGDDDEHRDGHGRHGGRGFLGRLFD
jgi:uncharacterized protein